MTHLNLLPVREIKRRYRATKQVMGFISLFFVVLIVAAAVLFVQKNTLASKQQTHKQLQAQIRQHQKLLNEIKKLETDKLTLERRIAIIDELKQSSSLTVHALDEVSSFVPPQRMWLESLIQKNNSLKLKGMALDNRTIAKFMDDLKSSEYIQAVTLAGSSMKTYAGRKLKGFDISCSLPNPSKEAQQPASNK